MRIAQIAPLYESVPPHGYGGTERVVSYLTEELVAQGHDVTLFASGDSRTRAKLVPGAPEALRLGGVQADPLLPHLVMLERAFADPGAYDVIHAHVDAIALPFSRRTPIPVVSTLHGRLDLEGLEALYAEYDDQWLVSISDSQREPLPDAPWIATVHHGLPKDLYRFHPDPEPYLAFIGRASPEKRVDRAIEIAIRSHLKLRIAAKVDRADREYFTKTIEPLLSHPLVEWVGEVNDEAKNDFIGNAAALLFPIDWPEPFGLTMIEALACGTPVIAWQHGSVAEVLEHGVTGFLCDDVGAAVRGVQNLPRLSRARCREEFERRFTARRMAADYLAIYEQLGKGEAPFRSETVPDPVRLT
ncbi:MAG TPA: glycosyltransferase family 4 protein [Candidatus Polarisedimenticolaceae bacterium]|nr:glycosyltransferase family 4 protein [Candidatus Polarisedimenticolaceae bacterium]